MNDFFNSIQNLAFDLGLITYSSPPTLDIKITNTGYTVLAIIGLMIWKK